MEVHCDCKQWMILYQDSLNDALAERSKAVAQGAIPKGRGFEPHSCHFHIFGIHCECRLPFMTACGAIERNGLQ